MTHESDKVMFEIYRESEDDQRHRVVYYTALNDHNREKEIDRALAGIAVYDGYLNGQRTAEAKLAIHRWLKKLDGGESFRAEVFEKEMAAHLTR